MPDLLRLILNLDPLWLVAILIGIVVVILIRAWQVQAQRQSFGYNLYTAESVVNRLVRCAGIGLLLVIAASAVYVWRLSTSPTLVEVPAPPPAPSPSLEGMELVITKLDVRTTIIEAPIKEN